jgi:hypothetical protein
MGAREEFTRSTRYFGWVQEGTWIVSYECDFLGWFGWHFCGLLIWQNRRYALSNLCATVTGPWQGLELF